MLSCRLGRSDANAALIANLMSGGHVPEMCDVTLALVKSDEGLLANGRASAAMVHQGETALVAKVRAVGAVVVEQMHFHEPVDQEITVLPSVCFIQHGNACAFCTPCSATPCSAEASCDIVTLLLWMHDSTKGAGSSSNRCLWTLFKRSRVNMRCVPPAS